MEWLEMIRLCGTPKDVQTLQESLGGQLAELRKTPGLSRTLVMHHATFGTDFAVLLAWDDERKPAKTREGLLLSDCLQKFGSVDHAVWGVLSDMPNGLGPMDKTKIG